jgi:rhodanese-related sulfurtransferase
VPFITKNGYPHPTFAEKYPMRYLSFLLLLFFAGCDSAAQNGLLMSVDEFEKGLVDKNVQLLDVRTAGEFRNGHLKGALQANWNDSEEFQKRIQALDKTKPVYVYCLSGPRSNAAAEWLLSNGFSNVVELMGGYSNWKRKGKPIEGSPNVKQMNVQDYEQLIAGKEYVLVDFGAEWCPPCRKMDPVINSFVSKNRELYFLKIDAGVQTDLMKKFNIEELPTFLFLKDGKEISRINGILSEEELQKKWSEIK